MPSVGTAGKHPTELCKHGLERNMQKNRFGMSFDMETVGHSSCCSRKPSKDVGERAREVVAGVCKVLPGTSDGRIFGDSHRANWS